MAASVSIVGAGRVGRALGRRLRELGWSLGAITARTKRRARAAVRAMGGGTAHAGLTRLVLGSDVVLVTTPDGAVGKVASDLARIGGSEWRGRVVLHASGALDRGALAPLERCGASTGSLHPMQTFTGRGVPALEGIAFAIEGDVRARRMAQAIVRALGGVAVTMEGRKKPAYHAAGALAAGHGLALVEAATQILMEIGFTRRRATRSLLSLMRQMLANFERLGPRAAWTGPLSRGDYATVSKHVAALGAYPREYGEAYAALSRLAGRVLSAKPEAALRQINRTMEKRRGGKR
jgi:predicted short-subunit dehydrogenase-like oxidoreductase (DUF2520 family)